MLAAVPFGADPQDTAEYLLGSVLVTAVFFESTGAVDPSTENWTSSQIAETKQKLQAGIEWWKTTLANSTSIHSLDFRFDFTHANTPVPTRYEPISRDSEDYSLYVNEFLDMVGFNTPKSISHDIRSFNHAQRLAHNTNWAFTVFVVNSASDSDGQFAVGGEFEHAFAFAGGRFIVAPSTRPESTFAHEAGHIFWARDEYLGDADWQDRRGYYDTQNVNAANNPTPGFVQQDSIMSNGTKLANAFNNHTSSPATLAMVGWRDSDSDGVFDVLDVPHTLHGTGRFDGIAGKYRFVGEAYVNTLPNLNSSGLQNDITINVVTRAEYRIDGGAWSTAATYNTAFATLNLSITVPTGEHQIEIRTVTIDPGTQKVVTSSPVFTGSTQGAAETAAQGIHGIVWNDVDGDGQRDPREIPLPDRVVRLVNQNGQPLTLQAAIEPDAFPENVTLNNPASGVRLNTAGLFATSEDVLSREMTSASTGIRVFAHFLSGTSTSPTWSKDSYEFQANFTTPQTYVSIDAIGDAAAGYARLEAYDASGKLLERYNTRLLNPGQAETMFVSRPTAEIASIKAFGRTNSFVLLDNLRYGHPGVTSTQAGGGYWLEDLPAGTYFVETTAPAGAQFTAPAGGRFQLTLTSGAQWEGRNFGVLPEFPWQNPLRPLDINNDNSITPVDVSIILAELVRTGARPLAAPTDGNSPTPFWDAKGDNALTAFDALQVLRYLATACGCGEGESRGASAASSSDASSSNGSDSSSDGAEGEAAVGIHATSLPPRAVRSDALRASADFALSSRSSQQQPAVDLFWANWDANSLLNDAGQQRLPGINPKRSQSPSVTARVIQSHSAAASQGNSDDRVDSADRSEKGHRGQTAREHRFREQRLAARQQLADRAAGNMPERRAAAAAELQLAEPKRDEPAAAADSRPDASQPQTAPESGDVPPERSIRG